MKIILLIVFTFLLTCCTTVDLEKIEAIPEKTTPEKTTPEKTTPEKTTPEKTTPEKTTPEKLSTIENEKTFLVEEQVKVQDIEDTVIIIDRPIYIPEGFELKEKKSGIDATKASAKESIIKPENYNKGTFYYTYNENFVYEVYAEPFHLTDIILEEGELVLGNPLLSEDEASWELTANVAMNPNTGNNIQHLFIKPVYSGLDSTLIILTNKRVYHFRIKSFKDTHMAMVKFNYPFAKNIWASEMKKNKPKLETEYTVLTNPEFLSFDYKMTYGLSKPEFLPQRVYDDGNKTYIVVNDIVLHKQLPLVFNENKEIINYTIQKNVFIIPRLINKITLRLNKEKVTIEKKKTKILNSEIENNSTKENIKQE